MVDMTQLHPTLLNTGTERNLLVTVFCVSGSDGTWANVQVKYPRGEVRNYKTSGSGGLTAAELRINFKYLC